jgi:hypothetical protein
MTEPTPASGVAASGRPTSRAGAGPAGVIAATALMLVVLAGCALGSPPSVWVDNESGSSAIFFVTDGSDTQPGWYIVPPHTTAHAGSTGLGSPDVTANVLGWGHVARHVGPCSPGDYDDTLYDVPRGASVELHIDPTGQPSVTLATEPDGLPRLELAPLNGLSEDQICSYPTPSPQH